MVVGLEMQRRLGCALTYHNYMGKTDGLFADADGWDHHCLILDNIDI